MIEVLFEDNHLLALDKPPGVETQGTLEEEAKSYIKKKCQKKGAVFLHAAHRLDQRASGICLFARTSKALSRLGASMREGNWQRIYHAKVERAPIEPEGTFVDYLRHGSGKAWIDDTGKRCELKYRLIGDRLLEIELVTGRYHQIRAQLSCRGMPIVGDVKYGARKTSDPGIALRQVRLSFPHPIGGERVTVVASPDPKFE